MDKKIIQNFLRVALNLQETGDRLSVDVDEKIYVIEVTPLDIWKKESNGYESTGKENIPIEVITEIGKRIKTTSKK